MTNTFKDNNPTTNLNKNIFKKVYIMYTLNKKSVHDALPEYNVDDNKIIYTLLA